MEGGGGKCSGWSYHE